ncbi:hypothetical protein D3C81_1298560 [compost metagenome]
MVLAIQAHRQLRGHGGLAAGHQRQLTFTGQRDEALDMHPTIRHAQALERADGRVHERARTTNECLGIDKRPRQFGQLPDARDALHRIQPVDDLQALRMSAGQVPEFILEYHRGLIAVGIDQQDPACSRE